MEDRLSSYSCMHCAVRRATHYAQTSGEVGGGVEQCWKAWSSVASRSGVARRSARPPRNRTVKES